MKLDEKKENTPDALNGGSVLASVPPNNAALAAGRLPRAVHEELALILKRIGTKEHNKDALSQLYDLRVSEISSSLSYKPSPADCRLLSPLSISNFHLDIDEQ